MAALIFARIPLAIFRYALARQMPTGSGEPAWPSNTICFVVSGLP